MRKLFTLCVLLTMAVLNLCAKDINIYVKAPAAPYFYYWGIDGAPGWPGEQLTETALVTNQTTHEQAVFYVKKFTGLAEDAKVNIIFNSAGGKTANIIGIGSDSYFTYDGATGYTNITDEVLAQTPSPVPTEPVYTVAGEPAGLFGTPTWNENNEANNMTKQTDGTYLWTKNATLTDADMANKASMGFKVVRDHSQWIPDGMGNNFLFGDLLQTAGTFDVTITFNPANKKITMTATQDVVVGSAGYATFAPSAKVDFSEAGLAPYAVTVNSSAVTLKPITGAVLPGTAVVLKAAANTYKVAAKWANHDNDGNITVETALKVSDGNVQGGDNIYVLANKSQGVGFYRLAAGVTVPAGKCYLDVPASAGAKDFLGFGDETTGISSVAAAGQQADHAAYNLAGQRVGKEFKGVVIKNGKKYVNK